MSEIEGEVEELENFIEKEEEKLKTAKWLAGEFAQNEELNRFYSRKIQEYEDAVNLAEDRIVRITSESEESD